MKIRLFLINDSPCTSRTNPRGAYGAIVLGAKPQAPERAEPQSVFRGQSATTANASKAGGHNSKTEPDVTGAWDVAEATRATHEGTKVDKRTATNHATPRRVGIFTAIISLIWVRFE